MPDIELHTLAALHAYQPGPWQLEYSNFRPGNKLICVASRPNSQDYLTIRNDLDPNDLDKIHISGIGLVSIHSPLDDPAFKSLRIMLASFSGIRVLRYRPAKRITICATHPAKGDVIVKCVASGVDTIYARLSKVWAAKDELSFSVSQPISLVTYANLFVQSKLSEKEIDFDHAETAISAASRIARAIGSLHRSRIRFDEHFSVVSQEARSERYLKILNARFPQFSYQLDALRKRLREEAQLISEQVQTIKPIHGSLHGQQWLIDDTKLGLVDFDRAGMGDVELDLATFVAQWDFESEPTANAVKQAFISNYAESANHSINSRRFTYYRAHKHLSKAYKSGKSVDTAANEDKLLRFLDSAHDVLSVRGDIL
ncbi:MAG: phosphotransferase [Burkholderiaceae bacterium]